MEWHRLLGSALADFFEGTPFGVEVDFDTSVQQQFLDIVVIRQRGGEFTAQLPDGLGPLVEHNLISFKSFQDTFSPETMRELVSYSVGYRKHLNRTTQQLIPETRMRLIGISARFPQSLHAQTPLQEVQPGVYDCQWMIDRVRMIVLNALPIADHNAMLGLFSSVQEQVRHAAQVYRPKSPRSSRLIYELLSRYRTEGEDMPFTLKDFDRESIAHILEEATVEERLRGLSIEDRLKGVPFEARIQDVPVEDRFKGVPVQEVLKNVPVEDRLKGVPFEARIQDVPLEDRLKGVPVQEVLKNVPIEARIQDVPVEDWLTGLTPEQIDQLRELLDQRCR